MLVILHTPTPALLPRQAAVAAVVDGLFSVCVSPEEWHPSSAAPQGVSRARGWAVGPEGLAGHGCYKDGQRGMWLGRLRRGSMRKSRGHHVARGAGNSEGSRLMIPWGRCMAQDSLVFGLLHSQV